MLLDVLRTAYRWYGLNKAPFEILGLSLAVLGTLFAMLSIKDGQKLTRDLRTVFDHLTTREAGAFPAYMQEVERLIADARESIFVATDFPAHGAWTDRGRYGNYVKALENRKADRVRRGHPLNIQLLTLDATARGRVSVWCVYVGGPGRVPAGPALRSVRGGCAQSSSRSRPTAAARLLRPALRGAAAVASASRSASRSRLPPPAMWPSRPRSGRP